MKRQCRVTEEAPQEFGMSGQASSFAAYVRLDVIQGVRGEVREAAVLQVAPQQLHWVEVRRVGRKPDDVAARMSGQPVAHELVLVRAPTIPHQDEGTAHMASEMAEEAPDLRPADVASRV